MLAVTFQAVQTLPKPHSDRREYYRLYHKIYARDKGKMREYRRRYVTSWPLRALLAQAKIRAAKSGLEFSISEADLTLPTHCPLLGIPLDTKGALGQRPSIDRIDNHQGYVPGNVIIVSWRANRIKSDASVDELVTIANNLSVISGRPSPDLAEQAAMQEKRVTDLRIHADMVGDLLIAVARQDAAEILRAAVAKAQKIHSKGNT